MSQMVLWILFLTVKGLSLKINLALNKKAYLSSVYHEYYARYAVDGNRDSYAHANNGRYFNSDADGWFVVDLGRPYQVEYIVLYNRYCIECDDRMDNFIVGLSNNFDPNINNTIYRDYKLCAKYNGSVDLGARVKMQCQDKESYSRYVIVQQDVGKEYLAIPEIEVFGEYINYVGCFKAVKNSKSIGLNYDLIQCLNTCEGLNYLYAALQFSKCSCGNDTKNFVPLPECNFKCPGDVDFCGSSDKFSVYEVFPLKFLEEIKRKYIGCFSDTPERDLTHNMSDISGMTIDRCHNYCAKLNYFFFGLQHSTCYCDNHYGKYGMVNVDQCNTKCIGNSSHICGGTYRNSIYSVYTDKGNYFNKNHHCINDAELDLNGTCFYNECKEGWTGVDCSIRNFSINNGDCGNHKCQTTNVNGGVYSECICKDGYDKKYWWDYCQDIDECTENMCNSSSSNCNNTEGGYTCICFKGFQSIDIYTCIDIDECQSSEHGCNSSTTTCQNTFGSYSCFDPSNVNPTEPMKSDSMKLGIGLGVSSLVVVIIAIVIAVIAIRIRKKEVVNESGSSKPGNSSNGASGDYEMPRPENVERRIYQEIGNAF